MRLQRPVREQVPLDDLERSRKDMYEELSLLRTLVAELNAERTERERLLERMRHRLQFDEIILDISKHFIDLEPQEVSPGICHALEAVGSFIGADCGRVFTFREDSAKLTVSHSWGDDDKADVRYTEMETERFPWFMQRLKSAAH